MTAREAVVTSPPIASVTRSVAIGVRSVGHHVEDIGLALVARVPPHDDVVEDGRIVGVEQVGVLSPPRADLGQVVGECALQCREGVRALDANRAEVRDVEHRDRLAAGHVFGDRARLVGDRHLPAAELDHVGAERAVSVGER
jgi:hypothetical protein